MSPAASLKTIAGPRAAPTWLSAEVLINRAYTDRYRLLRLHAPDIAGTARPGQFVMISAAREHEPGPVLPRPMAIYTRNAETGTLDVVYGVVGGGTTALATFAPGERLVVIGPLGQGFVVRQDTDRVLIIGRGVGICAMTTVAQDLADGVDLIAVLSGRNPASVIGAEVFRQASSSWQVNDADGTSDPGVLHDRLVRAFDDRPPQQILTSGSQRLTQLSGALAARWHAVVQVSVEAHMACGVGYCHGCPAGTGTGELEGALVCRDGPVFELVGTERMYGAVGV
ncbi:dihydroorotate oxidase electron transfer subunit [Saccharopolyspora sp. K220]|uniref:iron-sulfur cluster-binding protein n=1 Tax=Saccharopolyspora soli TaxID=2926618 RepID=UPI001F5AA8D2|nr:dihydroorotate oxidase electron transfer subunit [Saccharopolyspora soli]MCI2419736.1 dihydroorotate oxidase electron transfer subunit [Saccharopolyspora soli]